MKKQIVNIICFVYMLVVIISCGSNGNQGVNFTPPKPSDTTVYIVLIVDTESILNDKPGTHVRFANQKTNNPNKEFETKVRRGDKVYWYVLPYDNSATNEITDVQIKEKNNEGFDKLFVGGIKQNVAQISKDAPISEDSPNNNVYYYDLIFNINQDTTVVIDPKLQIVR